MRYFPHFSEGKKALKGLYIVKSEQLFFYFKPAWHYVILGFVVRVK